MLDAMANTTVTLDVPEDLWKSIDFAAFSQNRRPEELIALVMQTYLDACDRASLDRAMQESETDSGVESEEVARWLADVQARALKAA